MTELEKKKHLILAIDDQEENNLFISLILKEAGFEVLTSTNPLVAELIAKEKQPSVILLDVMMPRSGLEVCKQLKEDEATANIPVIFISAVHTSAPEVVEGLLAGSNDFIRKPFNPIELVARIKVAIRIKEAEDRIRELVAIDPLTGLYNRNLMYEFLSKEIISSRRYHENLSLLIVDIDNFKKINDTYGHLAGDQTLLQATEVIRGSFRASDICCRYAGDEFCIVLPRTSLENAVVLAERFKENIESFPINYEGTEIGLTVSIGLSGREDIELGLTPDKLIREADSALLKAKKEGKNCCILFESSMLV